MAALRSRRSSKSSTLWRRWRSSARTSRIVIRLCPSSRRFRRLLTRVLRLLALDGSPAQKLRRFSQFFLDAQQLVVLGDAVGAAGGAGLDLAGPEADREVGDEGVLGLARPVRDDGRVAVATRELDRRDSLRDRADLVQLDQNRVGRAFLDPALEPVRVGDEEVVAHELHAPA